MNLFTICTSFYKNNISYLIVNLLFVFIYYPLEMIIFGFLFGKIFSKIGDIKKNLNSIIILIAVIIIANVILEIVGYVKEIFDAKYVPRMENDVRNKIIDIIYKKLSINYEY